MGLKHACIGAFVALYLCLVPGVAYAGTTYHVSKSGADSNTGTRSRPFSTIGKAAAVMGPGDTCVVHSGTYCETIRPARSGVDGMPITFRVDRGDKVVVSGADPIDVSKALGGVYTAKLEGPVEQVFEGGETMNLARWPNAPSDPMRPVWAEAVEGSTSGKIVDPKLPKAYLAGAKIWVLPGRHWITWTRPVQGIFEGTNSVVFPCEWSGDEAYAVGKGTKYILFGARTLLDAPGEWYWDSESKRVALIPWFDGCTLSSFEVKRRDYAFDLHGCEHVVVDGFLVRASAINLADAKACVVRDCHLRYATHFTQSDGWGASASVVAGLP